MRILIIEDEISISKLLAYDFEQIGYDVETAFDGLEGFQMAMKRHFDIIVLDLMLPKMNGIEVCKKLRKEGCNSHIIMLTAMDDEMQKVEGFNVGADDYVTKPFSPRELAARIKAVRRRSIGSETTDTLKYSDIEINIKNYEVLYDRTPIALTLKEFELLQYLIINVGKALSREQLLTTLWGYSYDGDTRVVDVHIFKLREKIPLLKTQIKTVRGVGYQLI